MGRLLFLNESAVRSTRGDLALAGGFWIVRPGVSVRAYNVRAKEDVNDGPEETRATGSGRCGRGNGRRATRFCAAAGQQGNGEVLRKGLRSHLLRGGRVRLPAHAASGRRPELDDCLLHRQPPFNAIEEFKGEYRCITADLRNAPTGQSTGPVEVDRPWESYADDQLGLMDHLGIDKFMVMGFCIGGPFIWSLLKRAPNRIAAAVVAQPVGWRPEMRDRDYPGAFWKGWPAQITAKRPDITMQTAEQFVTRMFETNPDFVFTVTRDFVRTCQNPVLVLPDEVPAHPYAVAMECAMLAPKAEVSMFPWKEPKERIPLAVRQIHSFLRAHRPA